MKKILIILTLTLPCVAWSQHGEIGNPYFTYTEKCNTIDLDSLYIIVDGEKISIDTSNLVCDTGYFEVFWKGEEFRSKSFHLVGIMKNDSSRVPYVLLLPRNTDTDFYSIINEGDTILLIVKRMFNIAPSVCHVPNDSTLRETISENSLYYLKSQKIVYRILCSFLHEQMAKVVWISRNLRNCH